MFYLAILVIHQLQYKLSNELHEIVFLIADDMIRLYIIFYNSYSIFYRISSLQISEGNII
jgi:hypothetical protein